MGWVCDVDKKIKNKKSKHLGLNRQTYIAVWWIWKDFTIAYL